MFKNPPSILTKENEKEMFNLAMKIVAGDCPEEHFKNELKTNPDFAYFHGYKGESGYIQPLTVECIKYYKSKKK